MNESKPRMTLINLRTLEMYEVPRVPTDADRSTSARYGRPDPHGASHSPLVYEITENMELTGTAFDLVADTADEADQHDDFIRFLDSLLYSDGTVDVGDAPPDVLLVWPGWLSVAVKVTSVRERVQRFFSSGRPRHRVVEVTWTEVAARRILSSDVRRDGPRRADWLE